MTRRDVALAARLSLITCMTACAGPPDAIRAPVEAAGSRTAPTPIPIDPPAVRTYAVRRVSGVPRIDGRLDATEWGGVAWTEAFVDIEGSRRPEPPLETRVLMAWDDAHLYIGATLEEPHLQGSLQKRDTVIYLDNDFEVFIDPDGDTHEYFELEMNALGTEWDLRLPMPYRDGGRADNAWDIAGLRTAVSLEGTLNDPSDRDRGWSLEIAIPFTALGLETPSDGDRWRVNFSRVEWTFDTDGGEYEKRIDPATGRPIPESNWVWSPQFAVNMHMPELWGVVEFRTGSALDEPAGVPEHEATPVLWSLRRLYYAQRAYRREHGDWAESLDALDLSIGDRVELVMQPAGSVPETPGEAWRASIAGPGGVIGWIRADGRTWIEGGERQ